MRNLRTIGTQSAFQLSGYIILWNKIWNTGVGLRTRMDEHFFYNDCGCAIKPQVKVKVFKMNGKRQRRRKKSILIAVGELLPSSDDETWTLPCHSEQFGDGCATVVFYRTTIICTRQSITSFLIFLRLDWREYRIL